MIPWTIREETSEDAAAIDAVQKAAFGSEAEAKLVNELRDAGEIRLSLVALDSRVLIGHLLFSRMWIDGASESIEALALAPLAVMPRFQHRGVGTALMLHGLDRLRAAGHRIVLVVGHPEYYARFGFERGPAERLQSPYQCDAFLALEVAPGTLQHVTGSVRYPRPFQSL